MEVPKIITKHASLLFIIALIAFGIIWRLSPHIPNFAPISAIALIAGLALGWRQSLWTVAGVMVISDVIIGFYPGILWTWLSFALIICLGLAIKSLPAYWRAPIGALSASLVFFLVSNFGTWVASGMYSHTVAGFVQCYVMALPFLKATLLSDFFFITIALIAYEAVSYSRKKVAILNT